MKDYHQISVKPPLFIISISACTNTGNTPVVYFHDWGTNTGNTPVMYFHDWGTNTRIHRSCIFMTGVPIQGINRSCIFITGVPIFIFAFVTMWYFFVFHFITRNRDKKDLTVFNSLFYRCLCFDWSSYLRPKREIQR